MGLPILSAVVVVPNVYDVDLDTLTTLLLLALAAGVGWFLWRRK